MIDYKIISNSIDYYKNCGFQRIESPWTVTEAISNITKPSDKAQEFILNKKNKVLVASGEQSFLYLYLKGFLPLGKYQTVTPCFRDEIFDWTHSKYFIKNELIDTSDTSESNLEKITDKCFYFFRKYLDDVKIVKTDIGYDIMSGDIELGSYGIRTCQFLKWIYATGVAEPRLSNTIKFKNGIS
jgi:hypothetical protein